MYVGLRIDIGPAGAGLSWTISAGGLLTFAVIVWCFWVTYIIRQEGIIRPLLLGIR
jgi:hypothetical protein